MNGMAWKIIFLSNRKCILTWFCMLCVCWLFIDWVKCGNNELSWGVFGYIEYYWVGGWRVVQRTSNRWLRKIMSTVYFNIKEKKMYLMAVGNHTKNKQKFRALFSFQYSIAQLQPNSIWLIMLVLCATRQNSLCHFNFKKLYLFIWN